jgi:hypothetical protein
MKEETVSSSQVNWQARKQREAQFSALEDFANLGDTPEHWHRFQLKHPSFFPDTPSGYTNPGFRSVSEWLFTAADQWHSMGPVVTTKVSTPLIWYRNRLRAVWTRNDADGINLMFLLGFEKQAREKGTGSTSDGIIEGIVGPFFVPGQPPNPEGHDSLGGLPQTKAQDLFTMGIPDVDGVSGEIRWTFGSEFQQAVYELMKHRWRAMVCPTCGKFFVADKTARKHCSTECYAEAKRKSSLERWHAIGKAEREEKRVGKKRKRSKSRKGR